jgi:hypothetical protein
MKWVIPDQRMGKHIPDSDVDARPSILDSILIPSALDCHSIISYANVAILH